MSNWPQFAVIAWLTASIVGAGVSVVRPRRSSVILRPKQQRIAALAFAGAAISEASLLIAGGFFQGMF